MGKFRENQTSKKRCVFLKSQIELKVLTQTFMLHYGKKLVINKNTSLSVCKQTNNTLFRSLVHTYFKSLLYKLKVHQHLQLLFIHR